MITVLRRPWALVQNETDVAVRLPEDLGGEDISRFEAELRQVLAGSPDCILIECSNLSRVTSGHVGAIWLARSICEETGTRLSLSSASQSLIRVLKALDVYECFSTVDGWDETEPQVARSSSGRSFRETGSLKLKFCLTAIEINRALEELKRHLLSAGVEDITAIAVETLLYEAATNIRNHSGLDSQSEAGLTVCFNGDSVILKIVDHGREFDPTTAPGQFDPEVAISKRQKHGFGIAMMRRLSDSMSYARENGLHNVLTITKKLRE